MMPWADIVRPLVILIVWVTLSVLWSKSAHAQLISPGKLSRVHVDLEGITNCTSCHRLGEKGVSKQLCLDCHTPLAKRIERREGFHGGMIDRECQECHKEHFGRNFEIARFDTTDFDHKLTGFRLLASHMKVACRNCHTVEYIADIEVRNVKGRNNALDRTYLGLGASCGTCHLEDNPHRNQFVSTDCGTCHDESEWKKTPKFNHDDTAFPLLGAHNDVQCSKCHASEGVGDAAFVKYSGLGFSDCSSCHKDPHRGSFKPDPCSACHTPVQWHQIVARSFRSTFDHNKTRFALVGAHAPLRCESCHARPAPNTQTIRIRFARGTESHTFPRPALLTCISCHRDYHNQDFTEAPGGPNCENCHSQTAWTPSSYGLQRHNNETEFALTGAHAVATCDRCHVSTTAPARQHDFTISITCASCHTKDNVHGARFDNEDGISVCADCHSTESWAVGRRFDHLQTGFALTGRHATAACSSCHGPNESRPERVLAGLSRECASCHATDDPHEGQFTDTACENCHNTAAFTMSAFDHSKSRFPLEGAHQKVPCASCHSSESREDGRQFVRFKPLGTECVDCHGDRI